MAEPPQIIVIAGPNGAGKSTAAAHLLPEGMTFVNADEVAKTLPDYPSRGADLQAGRLVLEWMDDLDRQRASFAVETTLAGRSLATRITRLRQSGYRFKLIFLVLPSVDHAVVRVAGRVVLGGHNIPVETIRRRYGIGIRNFFDLYQPMADRWAVYDPSQGRRLRLIAGGRLTETIRVRIPTLWDQDAKAGER